ncbi:GGDEF domain-containing protein, partial [Mycolicibacterium llatzerense]|uniref:GGDEF domain-containing protein n=1 Tax=Mycolicibacterium llatzerense TaxID=280871 RepID=UPI0013A6B20D
MLIHHNTIGELIADTVQKLHSATTEGVGDLSKQALSDVGRFFALDSALLWYHNHTVGPNKLIAQWPARKYASALAPAFREDIDQPTSLTLTAQSDEFHARIAPGASIPEVISIAVAPLVPPDGGTVGTLELIRYGPYEWRANELDALKAIASIFAHVKIRTDHELEMTRLSEQDSLTGLWNRRKLIQHLEFRLSRSPSEPVAIFYISPDRLRTVNAVLGRAAGDQLVTQLSNELLANIGDSGFISL